jgi:hypothetical protein
VLVDMTGAALTAQAQVGFLQVLHLDDFSLGRLHSRRIVTAGAGETGVAAIQWIPGLAVVELVQAGVPADGDKFLAVVFGVAFGALFLAAGLAQERWVQALVRRQPLTDFGVAGEAAELALAAAGYVATGAVSWAFE